MNLGITRAADTKIRTAVFKLTHEVNRVTIIPIAAVALFKLIGQVTAQSHNVLNPGGTDFFYHIMYRIAR